jgi:hypothetical protein
MFVLRTDPNAFSLKNAGRNPENTVNSYVKSWLAKHPRFHMHFVPTSSSWLNMSWLGVQVEWVGSFLCSTSSHGIHAAII